MRIGKVLAILVVLLFAATSAMAAGFRLPEAGAKAMGMGFSFVAQADDPSAIYFNPAGIVQLEGQNVMIGGTYIRENGAKFTGTTPLTFNTGTGLFDIRSETQKDLNFFVQGVHRYGLLGGQTIVRHDLIEHLDDGLVLANERGSVVEPDRTCRKCGGWGAPVGGGECFDCVSKRIWGTC